MEAHRVAQLVDAVLAECKVEVAAYRAGQEKVFNQLARKVMIRSAGLANPAHVNTFLRDRLLESSL